jgi:hypothetical protein
MKRLGPLPSRSLSAALGMILILALGGCDRIVGAAFFLDYLCCHSGAAAEHQRPQQIAKD